MEKLWRIDRVYRFATEGRFWGISLRQVLVDNFDGRNDTFDHQGQFERGVAHRALHGRHRVGVDGYAHIFIARRAIADDEVV